MRWHLGADHAGYRLKAHLAQRLRVLGDEVIDHGVESDTQRVDYPDFAARVARAVVAEPGSFGLLVCGTGIGVSIAANRFPGVRAVLAAFEAHGEIARSHNDANVLCLGGRITAPELAERILDAFRAASFEGDRHIRRVRKIDEIARPEGQSR